LQITGQAASGKAKLQFTDSGKIADWAKSAVSDAVNSKIMDGMDNNTFAPNNNATRAQAAVSLKRLLQYIKFIN
jgi:bacillolysin